MIDQNDILSNKYNSSVEFEGMEYPSVENAFQASKFSDKYKRMRFARMAPFSAEYNGNRSKPDNPGWEMKRFDIMYGLLERRAKNDPEFRSALLDTPDREMIVTNLNHEHFWGVCECSKCRSYGENNLGKMLLQLKSAIKEDEP